MAPTSATPATSATESRKSETPGVSWNKAAGKWQGRINNQLERAASGGKKYECTTLFASEYSVQTASPHVVTWQISGSVGRDC